LDKELIADAVIAKNEAERAKLWHIRDDVRQAEQLAPVWAFDISLAISEMESYVNEVGSRLSQRWPEHHLHAYGHLGDGNLHLHVAVGENNPDTLHRIEEIVYEGIKARNGSVSAEHGIGSSKKEWLPYTRSSVEIDLMKRMKHLFDPKGILNPGKIFLP
jgi:FAD/FMN-containing dehydrogenase